MEMKKIFIGLIAVCLILIGVFLAYNINESDPGTTGEKKVLLYFSTQNAMYLRSETRLVNRDNLYINTLNELIDGPESSSLNKTIPEGVRVLGIKLAGNTARVNFNQALRENHWGGSTGEIMTIYSIVNTLTQFEAINNVQILIEGEEVNTLVGHMDLTGPLSANKRLIKEDL